MSGTDDPRSPQGEAGQLFKSTPAVQTIRAGRRTIGITYPDEVLFPETGITKARLADYYRRVGREMLPHLRGRPIEAECLPNRAGGEGIRWDAAPEWFPEWVERRRVGRGADAADRILCSNLPVLLFLVEQGMVTPHIWASRADRPQHPDRMIFELHPGPEAEFDAVRDASECLRSVLERLHLASFPMTTGGRGIHVVVPLTRRETFAEVHRFSRDVAQMAAAEAPARVVHEPAPEEAEGRVLVATDRNGFGRTVIAPYAVTGPSALVATPFRWNDLTRIDPRWFTLDRLPARLAEGDDPWRDMKRLARSLGRARRPL